MAKNTRRSFLKTVGLAVGAVSLADASSRIPAQAHEPPSDWSFPTDNLTMDWPMVRHDAGNTATAELRRVSMGCRGYRGANSCSTTSVRPRVSSPIIADGVAYTVYHTGNKNTLVAYDVETREVRWRTTYTSIRRKRAPPVVDDGRVIVAGSFWVRAFDAETGENMWTFTLPGGKRRSDSGANQGNGDGNEGADDDHGNDPESPGSGCENGDDDHGNEGDHGGNIGFVPSMSDPVLADGTVYLLVAFESKTQCYAISAERGGKRWQTTVSDTGPIGNWDTSIPAVADGSVYVAHGRTLTALDMDHGHEEWSHDLYSNGPDELTLLKTPVVADGTVFVSGSHTESDTRVSHLTAVSGEDGAVGWQSDLNGYGDYITVPTVADGHIYAGDRDGLRAFAAATGSELWDTPSGGAVHGPLSVADGVIYSGSRSKVSQNQTPSLVAYDTTDGSELWYVPLREGMAQTGCSIADDHVYVIDTEGFLYSLSGPTSESEWQVNTEGRDDYYPEGSPLLGDSMAYVPDTDGTLRALDRQTGENVWTFAPGGNETGYGLTLGDGTLYYGYGERGQGDWRLYALDATTGEVQWRYAMNNGMGQPVLHDGTVYVGGTDLIETDPKVYAIDAETGEKRWSTYSYKNPDIMDNYRIVSPPVVVDDTVVVASTNGMVAYDAVDGREQWRKKGSFASCAADGERVYVASARDAGSVTALNPADGSEEWTAEIDPKTREYFTVDSIDQLVVADRRIYVPASDYSEELLCVLDASDGSSLWTFDPGVENDGWRRSTGLATPVVTDDAVFIGAADRRVYVLDPRNGDERTRLETFAAVYDPPAVDDGRVVATSGEWVYSFD